MSKKKRNGFYYPITPGGTIVTWLASTSEEEAWTKLLKDAAHMPYNGKEGFYQRGYRVEFIEGENLG